MNTAISINLCAECAKHFTHYPPTYLKFLTPMRRVQKQGNAFCYRCEVEGVELILDEVEIVPTQAPLQYARSGDYPGWWDIKTNAPQETPLVVAYVSTEADALFLSYAPEMRNLLLQAVAGENIKEKARDLFLKTQLNRVVKNVPETPLDDVYAADAACTDKDLYVLYKGSMAPVLSFIAGSHAITMTFMDDEDLPITVQASYNSESNKLCFGAMLYVWGEQPVTFNLQLFKGNKK